jgi:hypothetical protein
MPRRNKVLALPPELRKWLDDELMRRGFSDYDQLAADLRARGADVSASGLQRYGSPFEKAMALSKIAAEQARALVDAVPDDQDKLGAAVIRVTQQKILNLLMETDIDPENVDVNKLFKNAAEIGKTSAAHKRFTLEARAAIEDAARKKLLDEQRAKLDAMGNKGGVTADTLQAIRAALGIK